MAGAVFSAVAQTPPTLAPNIPAEVLDAQLLPLVRSIDSEPAQAGLWLDLALALCQRGQGALTQQVLGHIEETFKPPPGIVEVINLVRQSGCDMPSPRSVQPVTPPRVNLSAQRGRDSNVNQGASSALFALGSAFPGVVVELTPEFLPVGDQFTALEGGITYSLDADLQAAAQVRLKRHDTQHSFDTGVAAGTVEQSWPCGSGRCSLTGALGAVTLGSRLYQTLAQVQIGWTHALQNIDLPQAIALEASLGRQLFATQPSFDAWLAQARASWRVLLGGSDLLQLAFTLGIDKDTANRPGGDRRVYALQASGSHALGHNFALDWSAQQQTTQDATAYSPGLIDMARRPVLRSVVLGLARPVADFQRVRVELRHTSHRDVVSLFTYRNTGISVAWLWDFNLR